MSACNDTVPMRATLAMLLVALAFSGCSVRQEGSGTSQVARVGQRAPNVRARAATGGVVDLGSLRGKAVYLNFFATWCPPCNEEAPTINALQKRYRGVGLRVVGVDELENAGKAREFVRKYGLTYPAIVDDGALQGKFEINGLPVHVFIDRAGIVKKIVVGEMKPTEIAGAVRSIL